MRKTEPVDLDRHEARVRFRQHLARAGAIMDRYAQQAMAEAHDNVRKAAPILSRLVQADVALAAELEAMRGLEKYLPEWDWSSESPMNAKIRPPKRRKGHVKKL